jgi:DNA-binding MarR family transcriptional regulator
VIVNQVVIWPLSYGFKVVEPVVIPAPSALPAMGARVGYLIYRVERRLRARLDEAVREHGLTTTEYVTLSVIHGREGMSAAQLARRAFVSPQAMNVVIARLERRQLVTRRPDTRHKRVLRTSVTGRGVEILERCDRSMDRIEDEMLRDLPANAVEALRRSLAACAHALEASRFRELL